MIICSGFYWTAELNYIPEEILNPGLALADSPFFISFTGQTRCP